MRLLLILILTATATVCSGCAIGIKEIRKTVLVSPVPIPESAKGMIMIRTNRPIPLVIADKEFVFEQNVGGYVICDPWFYDLLIQTYKAQKKK